MGELRTPGGPLGAPAGMKVLVGGGAAEVTDVVGRIGADFPRTAIVIVLATYLVLLVLLRSVVLPAKALVMNSLSIVASVRRARLDLPGRQPVRRARLPAARVRRDEPARDPVLRPLRAVDGLRGVPADTDARGVRPDRRQPRGCRGRPRAQRADRDERGADRRRGRGFVRAGGHRADQGPGPRHGDRRGPGRDRGPGPARAGHDAAPGALELVDARAP